MKDCLVHKFSVRGRNVFSIRARDMHPGVKTVLYLHGGAYVQCFNRYHWQFLAELASNTKSVIIAPDYPLAPAFTVEEAFSMVEELYLQLAATRPKEIVIMGDSAGGGFALALAQKMRDIHVQQAAKIILLSPWLDLTLSNPEIDALSVEDPFLERESLIEAGKLFAGKWERDHYQLSPINGPLKGLGEISLFVGTKEILVADARKLKLKASQSGISINYYEYAEMIHAWIFLNLPESTDARRKIFKIIKS